MSKDIKHIGTITEIVNGTATVEFVSKSACASCHAKMACGVSDESIKVIQVTLPQEVNFSVGETVNILLRSVLGMKAVLLGYVIPLAVLLIILVSLQRLGMNDLYSGLVSLGAVGIYYFILFLFRKRLNREYEFVIEKYNQ